MSWDPQGGYDNSGYGNYSDNSSYGMGGYGQPQQQQHSRPASRGARGQASYDMFGGYEADTGPTTASPAPQSSSSFYNPNDYSYQGQQQQQFQQQQSLRRSPVPSQQQQQQHPQANFGFPGVMGGAQGMNPLVADMAMQYGQTIMGKGQEEIKRNLDKYVSVGQLKYYFAVDTTYVAKKLGLLMFPFTHTDWSIQYAQDEPVQPKFDVNAPDLYIPTMAYVTYILLCGYVLGLRHAFSPDLLATTATSALVWLCLEIGCIYLTLTIMSISTNLCKWDVIAFSTYKYVGMIAIVMFGLLLQSQKAYYGTLCYMALALAFFLVRALKLRIEPEVHGMQVHGKRKLYLILFYAGLQPLLMWWLTSYFMPLGTVDMPTPVEQP